MASNLKALADVLSPKVAKELRTGSYDKALPITIQDFELAAVLPVIFYMFRFGQRRGKGQFLKTFSPQANTPQERRRDTTIERVASALAKGHDLAGFDSDLTQAILGDLLLCFGLENVNHQLGQDKQIQRAFPTHYLTSWIDLPDYAANLRGVPEMLVAILVNQKKGDHIEQSNEGWFKFGPPYNGNPLLRAFAEGVYLDGQVADRRSDRFDESNESVGLDQLLMIKLAQLLRAAPDKATGRQAERIPNQRPIAALSARHFSEDIRRFLRSYASELPRLVLVDMLEACMAVGLTTILTSTVNILFRWLETGHVQPRQTQRPVELFVDCSTGVKDDLRLLSEHSLDDLTRQLERVPATLTTLRLLDYHARQEGAIKALEIKTCPHAAEWFDLLGALLHKQQPHSVALGNVKIVELANFVHRLVDRQCGELASELEAHRADIADLLLDRAGEPNPMRRFAAGLSEMRGPAERRHLMGAVDSIVRANRPNGLAQKRRTTRGSGLDGATRRTRDVRSLVFSDAVLEYLVHVQLLPAGNRPGTRSLSMKEFLDALKDRYGFCVDAAPNGLSVSNDLLQLNRRTLERRLRDLGLLVGVNDAESMKRLRPRFEPKGGVEDG